MESDANSAEPVIGSNQAVGRVYSAGVERYLLEAASSTGYVAWKMTDGTILVSAAARVSLRESPSIEFWSCTGYEDTSPAGYITAFDCHGNGITALDVGALTMLEYLDASYNLLRELNVKGLHALQALEVEDNQLASLGVGDLPALRVLNCANNRLTTLDLSGLPALRIFDGSNNQLTSIRCAGCSSLEDFKDAGNPMDG